MNLIDLANAVSQTTWAQDIAGSWMFPLLETLHVFSLIAVLGTVALVDWRLIGFANRAYSVTTLSRQALPWTWGGFVVAVVSGALMTVGQAGEYITNPAFQLKLALMVLAGLNMAAFHLVPWRTVGAWDTGAPPPAAARAAGLLSLTLWIGVIACGRWIAFTHGA
jgi:uncharacterized membrane protein